MPLAALATRAGETVVAAAVTGAWASAAAGFARLLGRGDPDKTSLAARRLAETHDQLAGAGGADLDRVRAVLRAQWVTRMADLLDEDPAVEADMRGLVDQIQVQLPAGVSTADHSVAAGGDVNIDAASGGVAAGVIHGDVLAGQWQLPAPEATAGQPVRLAPRPPVLAGREALLAELDIRLAADEGSAPCTVALCGLGGAGKTSVAVEYAHRHLAEVAVAWQFPAEDATLLAAGFGELAAQLGAKGLADARDPVASVHAVLAGFTAPWLLIFDDAVDLSSVAAFLPPAGPGRVLVTSQNPNWPGQAMRVRELDPDVASDFLVKRTGDSDRQAGRDLGVELGGLPLALERAAAYIHASGDSLAGYLALFRRRRADMLARGAPTRDKKTVATVFALAFEDLQQHAPRAVGLLRLLAYCAPEAIPLRLLLEPRPGLRDQFGPEVAPVLVPLLDEIAARDAIAALHQYSLVIHAGEGLVSVHRLVQVVTADQMPAELAGEWRHAAAALIEAAIPEDPRQPDTWPVFAVLLPHAQTALAADSDGLTRIASYLGHSGSYVAAREFSRRLLDERLRILGAEDPRTLGARHDLAWSTGEAGDAAEARDQLAALLSIEERVRGAEHPDTLITRLTLAAFTGQAGDAPGARDQFAALLPVEERVLGSEHRNTLTTRHDLAYWTGMAGDAAAARDQLAALLPDEERVLGPDHPRTLETRIHLAWSHQEAGDAAAARDQFAALLPITERVLGPDHPRTLVTRHDVAWSTGEAGDWAGARDQLTALLPDEERVLGPEHPLTLKARYDLARCTGKTGDAPGARDQLAALLPIREQVLDREHPDILDTRRNLAYWTKKAEDDARTA